MRPDRPEKLLGKVKSRKPCGFRDFCRKRDFAAAVWTEAANETYREVRLLTMAEKQPDSAFRKDEPQGMQRRKAACHTTHQDVGGAFSMTAPLCPGFRKRLRPDGTQPLTITSFSSPGRSPAAASAPPPSFRTTPPYWGPCGRKRRSVLCPRRRRGPCPPGTG